MKILAENRRARFNYEILETLEAGLALAGAEVKSIKNGGISLNEAFVTFHHGQAYLTNAHVSPYKQAGKPADYDPRRSRPLLLHRRELRYLGGIALEKGLTIVPLKVYTKHRLVKIEVAVGRGKKLYDKREVIKKRDIERDIKRSIRE